MNIIDMLNKPSSENKIAKKIAIKKELGNIESRMNDLSNQVLNFISSELELIENDLQYKWDRCPKKFTLTSEEKKQLTDKLVEAFKALPENIEKTVSDIATDIEQTKTEEPVQPKQVEVEVTSQTVPVAPQPSSIFGY